jgi:hypothetical protein
MKVAALGAFLIAACGGPGSVAGRTPTTAAQSPTAQAPASASASTSATPFVASSPSLPVGSFGVLVGAQASSTYTIALVDVGGKVVASATASTPANPSCAGTAGAPVPPPVSTSDSRVYYMDAGGAIRYLAPDGKSGLATSVPAPTASRRSTFAVSPDDRRIAVVVADYSASGASTKLYVENLVGGGSHVDLFSETGGHTLWATGWHGTNNLVLSVVVSCTQGGGPFCCGPQELHVVDPATANRRFTLGSTTSCPVGGPPSTAGVVCEAPPKASVLNWTAGTVRTFTIAGPIGAYLSPNGSRVALVDNTGTTFTGGGAAMAGVFTCGWIDDSHVLAGGDSQQQPRVGDLATGKVAPVAAQGDCAGRIPGGL